MKYFLNKLRSLNLVLLTSLLTSIATLVTAVATFEVVNEMKKQRATTSTPILKINYQSTVEFFENDDTNFFLYELKPMFSHKFEYKNFGTGPALNINTKWNIDLEKINDLFKNKFPNAAITITKEGISIDKKIGSGIFQYVANYDAIYNNSKETFETTLPPYYELALKKYITLLFESKQTTYLNLLTDSSFPSIEITVSYEDIVGDSYVESYQIEPHIHITRKNDFNEKNTIFCDFKLKKIINNQ